MKKWTAVLLAGAVLMVGCSAAEETASDPAIGGASGAMTAEGDILVSASAQTGSDRAALLASLFPDNVTVTVDGNTMIVTLHTNGIPNHETGPFPGNPNTVQEQDLTFRIPLNPQVAAQPTQTNMGPIGIAASGAVFFNPYTADGQDATQLEILDRCGGHPQQTGTYHYHEFSECVLQDTPGQHSGIFGIALDGFLVYGMQGEGGVAPTDLDACNGHTGPTPDKPDGEYHYHVTEDFPYILGCYAGTPSQTGGPQGGGGGQSGGDGQPGVGQPGGRRGGGRP